ncbi:hypothetical protein M7I_3192 [Glarea lozoyensis 74030]|uniref:Uncharacterized protein n=1 Tax=Glarea lozoyensis (strain ATCC 74030 / MF5533) TaxID=1104152 RepID=H0EKV9_GLAL7|nr:hypothetical protein M7I_3192 [Glarea lozoyensis 74030]
MDLLPKELYGKGVYSPRPKSVCEHSLLPRIYEILLILGAMAAAAPVEQHKVSNDPDSNRSWNYAWLVLIKIQDDALVDIYAEAESVKPEMWDGRVPEPEEAQQLAACFVWEWKEALDQMLRHWETPPTTTGY